MRAAMAAGIVLIGLGAIAAQQFSKWQHQAISSAKQLATSMQLYAVDHDDVFPLTQDELTWQRVLMPYLRNRDVFKTSNPAKSSWVLNQKVEGVGLTAIDDPVKTPLIYDSKPWPDGRRVVAFVDGHTVVVDPEKWKAVAQALKKSFPRIAKKPLPKGHFKKEAGF